ncbi:hypothetical protein HAX54_048401, partial [Datura stramonium]|nr:hypothetical protein [Datura stramonium]
TKLPPAVEVVFAIAIAFSTATILAQSRLDTNFDDDEFVIDRDERIKVAIEKKFNFIDYTWNWSKVCLVDENFRAVITSKIIKWVKPLGATGKLNTDGSYIKNQDKAGAGGIVRNRTGNMIMAFLYPTQFFTNNYSEAQVALIGISCGS